MNGPFDHRETADKYHGEITRCGKHRVVVCKDGIQWIMQRRKPGAGARWFALSYCATRAGLSRLWLPVTGVPLPDLHDLPKTKRGKHHD